MPWSRAWMSVFVLVSLSLVSGCGGSDIIEEARVRVVHASPDFPSVNILVDNDIVFQNVPYKRV